MNDEMKKEPEVKITSIEINVNGTYFHLKPAQAKELYRQLKDFLGDYEKTGVTQIFPSTPQLGTLWCGTSTGANPSAFGTNISGSGNTEK